MCRMCHRVCKHLQTTTRIRFRFGLPGTITLVAIPPKNEQTQKMADLEEEPSGDFAPQSVGAGEEAGGEANGDAASSKHASPSTDSEHEGDLDGEGDDATNGDADDENMEDKDDTEAVRTNKVAEIFWVCTQQHIIGVRWCYC